MRPNTRRPGDLLLDRYLPDASAEDRERAREVFRAHALLLIRMGERVMREQDSGAFKDSEDLWKVPEVQRSW